MGLKENLLLQFYLTRNYLKEKNRRLNFNLESIQDILEKTKVCLTIQRGKTFKEFKKNLKKNIQIKNLCKRVFFLQEKKKKNEVLEKKMKLKIFNEIISVNVAGEVIC